MSLLESHALWHILACLWPPFAGGSLLSGKHLRSRAGCGRSHRVPAEFPAVRVSHSCSWFVQSGRVWSLSKNTPCDGFWRRRSGEVRLSTGLLSELSAQRSCTQETSKSIRACSRSTFPHGMGTPGETEAQKKWGNVFLTLSLDWHVAVLLQQPRQPG